MICFPFMFYASPFHVRNSPLSSGGVGLDDTWGTTEETIQWGTQSIPILLGLQLDFSRLVFLPPITKSETHHPRFA